MANLAGIIDHNAEPSKGFDADPLPVGKYIAAITASELKPTNDGTGKYLNLEFTVIDGEHKGRKLWTNLNLVNNNPDTVKYAQADLAAINQACGVKPTMSEQLHDIPLVISVKIEPAKGEYGPKNKITRYAKLDGTAGSIPTTTKPAATKAAPPWAGQKKSA